MLARVGILQRHASRSWRSLSMMAQNSRRPPISLSDTSNPIPATFLRGGTSKGIFINRAHLPDDTSQWPRIFLGIMGSPDPEYGRQLNGMGGGISSLSKICVVGPPASLSSSASTVPSDIQVEYTFVQVGIRDSTIDLSGNCGNLSSMIGVFAVDEGICSLPHGSTHATIRSWNTNTQKVIDTTFPINNNEPVLDNAEASIAGVPGKSSEIVLDFVNPAGARTGKLLPSKSSIDVLEVILPPSDNQFHQIEASLVDATNPTIFVHLSDLQSLDVPIDAFISGFTSSNKDEYEFASQTLERIRQAGALRMGLDPRAQAQPKLAILSSPRPNERPSDEGVDVVIHALSMGVLHKAVPMTVGLCLGVASNVERSIPWEIVQQSRATRGTKASDAGGLVRIRHPSGTVDVGAEVHYAGTGGEEDLVVKSAKVVRTGRRLMKGVVWW